ncbi:MAG: polyprenol monophosphomannose synthase [Elusimicrobiota bacterium]
MILTITPTYNEKQNIKQLVEKITSVGNVDLLVIDDNSPDGTAFIVEELRRQYPGLHLIKREKKMGLGTAYIEGFRWALERNYQLIITIDADLSHNPDYIPVFLEGLKEFDFVVGSRYVPEGGTENWPLKRRIISRFGNCYARTIAGIPINDCTSGFTGFKRQVLEQINFDNIHSEGYGFLIELKYRAVKKNFNFREIPIIFVERRKGKSKISRKIIFEAMILAWRLRFSGRAGK